MSLKIKLIATDFDGTIFQENESPPVPVEVQNKIISLQSKGCKWVISTGRDLLSVLEGIARAKLEVRPDFLVTVEREIYIKNGGSYKPLEDWNKKCDILHYKLFEKVRPFIPKLTKEINSKFKATIYADGFSPFCIIAENNRMMDEICEYLLKFCSNIADLSVMRNDVYARLCHKNYNKGTTMLEISRLLGLKPDSIFTAGDHINDLPMLDKKIAKYIAAPSNAVDVVKLAVQRQNGYLCQNRAGLGVLEALNYYLEN